MAQRQLDLVISFLEKLIANYSEKEILRRLCGLSRLSTDLPMTDQGGRDANTYRNRLYVDSRNLHCSVNGYLATVT